MTDSIETIVAPTIGAEANQEECMSALKDTIMRTRARLQRLEDFIERTTAEADRNGAVLLRVKGNLYRLMSSSEAC